MLHWAAPKDFECRHGTWCMGQVFHNIVGVGGPCIHIMYHLYSYYVSFVEELPSRGEAMCQNMASQSDQGHQDGKRMLALAQHE